MAAECELTPERLRVYFAELIRLREFAAVAGRYKARLPLKVHAAFERAVPPRSEQAEWVEAAVEERIEAELHPGPGQERLL